MRHLVLATALTLAGAVLAPSSTAQASTAQASTAQSSTIEVALRDGTVCQATRIEGDPRREVTLTVGGERRRIPAGNLLCVHGAVAQVVDLPAALLAGGECVRGQLVGGDDQGDRLELLSPVLGRIDVAVDRLTAFAAAGVERPLSLDLPEGVGEAVFQRAAVGYDVVAGVLHRFGEQGLLFQPEGADTPRWFAPTDFVAWRPGESTPRKMAASAELLTRTGDRVGVVVRSFSTDTCQCELDGGRVVDLRLADLSCISFAGVGTFLSDLEPQAVLESGHSGEVVHPWQRNASAVGGPLTTAGRTHGKGVGAHSRSKLTYRVPAGAGVFWTRVGLDDSSSALGVRAEADVRILVDGAVRFERLGLLGGAPQDAGRLPVHEGQTITLEVDFGRGQDIGDRVNWLSPVFLTASGRRP